MTVLDRKVGLSMESRNSKAFVGMVFSLLVLSSVLVFAESTYGQRGTTTTDLMYPSDGATVTAGSIFNVTVNVRCTYALCKHFVTKATVEPSTGIDYAGLNATHNLGDMGINISKIQYWIYNANTPGVYTIKVESTSNTAESSMQEFRLTVLSAEGEQPPAPTAAATAVPTARPTAVPTQSGYPSTGSQETAQPMSGIDPILLLAGVVVLAGIVYYVYSSQKKVDKK